jgi:hypothetical protein
MIAITPRRSACHALAASPAFWVVIDALGITADDLAANDLAPRGFVCSGFQAIRKGPAAYLVWRRRVLPGDDDSGWGVSRPIVPPVDAANPEQQAGAELLEFAGLGSGADAQALRRWLQQWGWEPPQAMKREPAPPPMVL